MENDLITDLLKLESLLDTFEKSRTVLKNFQFFQMRLFSQHSLSDAVDYVLEHAKDVFGLDAVTLCLLDEYGEIGSLLKENSRDPAERKGLLLLSDKEMMSVQSGPYTGAYDSERFGHFFAPFGIVPAGIAVAPLTRRDKCLGILSLGSHRADRFSDTTMSDLAAHLSTVIGLCIENHLNVETIRQTSYIDTLTGVNNRRFLEQRIGEELDRCNRNHDPITCMFLDIDYFKSVNDQYGHQVGDKVLSTVAKTIKSQLRNNDVLARYGGEEFIALLTNINQSSGFEIAERIRRNVQSLRITFSESTIPVTLSIGLSTYLSDKKYRLSTREAAAHLISTADSAMYQAKNKGRNRIEYNEIVFDRPLVMNG